MTAKAVILAAGYSERLFPISLEIPKPLLTLGGRTLIELVINRITKFSVADTVYASVGYQHRKVSRCFTSAMKNTSSKYGFFVDEAMPGTSYWLFRYQNHFLNGDLSGDSLWVTTVDNGIQVDYNQAIKEFDKLGRPGSMIIPVPPDNNDCDGDLFLCDAGLKVINIIDRNDEVHQNLPKDVCIGSGLQLINPQKIIQLSGSNAYDNFRDLWKYLLEKGELYIAKTTPRKWCKIDTIEDWKKEIMLFSKGESAYNL